MKIIGLTGTSGSGKGFVCALLESYGIESVDTDSVVHELYEKDVECRNELREAFGEEIFAQDGSLCRPRLAEIVFSDKEKLALLNATVHKYVIKKCDELAQSARQNGKKAIVIDAPQLYEAKMENNCDFVIAVVADTEIRRERLSRRDHIAQSDIDRRIKNQHTDDFFRKNADYVIINNGKEEITPQIEKILASEGLFGEA